MFEDRGGILTVVGGFVALAVVATGLALVMEKRSDSAKLRTDAEKTLSEDQQTLEILKDELSRAKNRWQEISGRTAVGANYAVAKAAADKRSAELGKLRKRHQDLKESVAVVDGDFTKYQREYVSSVRNSAEGEEVGALRLKSGKEYLRVTITRATPEGLEIRHEFGSARVAAGDLDEKWNERFLWR